MKIGLFFGSFNPIHIGHLIIANTMAENTDLQEVWLVVSPQNPLKKNAGLLHEFDRYEMVSLAIHDSYKIKVSDIEFNLPRPSYTILQYKSLWQLLFLVSVPLFILNIVKVKTLDSKSLDPYLKQMALTTLLFVFSFGIGLLLA